MYSTSVVGIIAMHILLKCHMKTLTFSDWASKDFRLLVTFFSSSSRSLALLWREADIQYGWFE